MTPEAQRIAIAEALGIETWKSALAKNCVSYRSIPDYLNDLNAMHEAEKMITKDQQLDYAYNLKEIACPITGEDWMAIHTTAGQRSEAFLRTIGKWVE